MYVSIANYGKSALSVKVNVSMYVVRDAIYLYFCLKKSFDPRATNMRQ